MEYNSPEHKLIRNEIRDKNLWSYFWAATAGITAVASVVMGFGIFGFESTLGTLITALGGVGAGVQAISYDREMNRLHEKLEVELAKGGAENNKELGGAIKELSHEIHALREAETPAPTREDGKSWVEFVEAQRSAPAAVPKLEA